MTRLDDIEIFLGSLIVIFLMILAIMWLMGVRFGL
jgi:hypothetical protein